MPESAETFDIWAIIELFGHQRRAGRVTKAEFPEGFVRLDVPDGPTQFLNPKSIYALTPTTEDLARAAATQFQPEPIQAWELPPPIDRVAAGEVVDEDGGPW